MQCMPKMAQECAHVFPPPPPPFLFRVHGRPPPPPSLYSSPKCGVQHKCMAKNGSGNWKRDILEKEGEKSFLFTFHVKTVALIVGRFQCSAPEKKKGHNLRAEMTGEEGELLFVGGERAINLGGGEGGGGEIRKHPGFTGILRSGQMKIDFCQRLLTEKSRG